jgi:co-chaperonin GroES (HSP10)
MVQKLRQKNYEPVADSIWVHVDLQDALKPDRIVLPNNAKLPPFLEAEVLAVGPKCTQVKAGDVVLLNAATIMPIKIDGEELTFTLESRVVAISRSAI